jgi:hypothetical protein
MPNPVFYACPAKDPNQTMELQEKGGEWDEAI